MSKAGDENLIYTGTAPEQTKYIVSFVPNHGQDYIVFFYAGDQYGLMQGDGKQAIHTTPHPKEAYLFDTRTEAGAMD